MKTYKDIAAAVFARRDAMLAQQAQTRKTRIRVLAAVVPCLVIAALAVGLWLGNAAQKPPVSPHTNSATVPTDTPITNSTNPPVSDTPPVSDDIPDGEDDITDDLALTYWNGKTVTMHLAQALNNATTQEKLVIRLRAVGGAANEEFLYAGKSLAAYKTAIEDKRAHLERLRMLVKQGEDLKYGEALITTGNADGIKWAKYLYERTVAQIGQKVLDTYIVDGVFFADRLNTDIETLTADVQTAEKTYHAAQEAYRRHQVTAAKATLDTLRIPTALSADGEALTVTVTRDEFATLSLGNMTDWRCSLAESIDEDEGMDFDDATETQ